MTIVTIHVYIHTVYVDLIGQSMIHISLEICNRTVCYCGNETLMHTFLEGMNIIFIDLANYTNEMPEMDRKVDTSSVSRVGS